jgi:flagellar hook-length control protein FliK
MQCVVEGPARCGSGGTTAAYSANPALLERLARDLERTVIATPTTVSAAQPEIPTQTNTTAHDHRHSVEAAPPAPAPLQDMLALSKVAADFAPRALDAGVGSKTWQEQLGNQLSWMIDRGEQMATLRLSPDHLGPLEVRIAVRESEATVWFAATQPETRAALELAMPRLRDMLATQGIALLHSGVSNGSPRQPQPRAQHPGAATPGAPVERLDSGAVSNVRGVTLGLVDLYA